MAFIKASFLTLQSLVTTHSKQKHTNMNRLYVLLAMMLFVGSVSAQVLVNETFENGNTVDQPPVGWICNDGGWKAGITIPDDNVARGRKPHTGDWYMYASYNTDVWIYKEINVTEGSYYRVSFWYATWHVDHFNLEIKAGASATPEGMTVEVLPMMVVENEEYEQTSAVFQATSSGAFYVGFHSVATNWPWYMSIDDVVIEQTDLYHFALEALTPDTSVFFGEPAYLRFNIINSGSEDETISLSTGATSDLSATFYANGAQVTELNVPYGETVEVTAMAELSMNLSNLEELHLIAEAISTLDGQTESLDFKITAMAPLSEFPLTEGFEEDFPPFGWLNFATSGNYAFEQTSQGTEPPATTPHNGSQYMARFYCYTNAEGHSAELVTPKMQLNASGNRVSFWLFRNANHNINRPDRINVYFNTEPSSQGGQLIGTVHRCTFMEPVVADVDDWYEYSFEFNSTVDYGFVIFEGVSGYGWNLYLDDVIIDNTVVDEDAPTLVSVTGTQQYAETEMTINLRAYDASAMPSTLSAIYTIDGTSFPITFSQDKGNFDYHATLPAQPDHTEGSLVVTLVDELGNSAPTEPIALHWDYQRPLLFETFEECSLFGVPEGWTTDGNPTWWDWSFQGTVYYTDYYMNEFVVSPHRGSKQAVLEWDDSENPMAQDQTLITPVLEITRPTVLEFWTWVQYGTDGYDHFQVRVYDTYNGTWEDKWDAEELPSGQINQYDEPISINLDEYIGRTIKIGFRGYNSFGEFLAFDWFIDDVKVIVTDTIDNPNPPTVIGTEALQPEVRLYPNPAKDQLHIDAKATIHSIEVVAVNGMMMENRKVDDRSVDLLLEGYSKGVYFLRLITDEGVLTKKIVVE